MAAMAEATRCAAMEWSTGSPCMACQAALYPTAGQTCGPGRVMSERMAAERRLAPAQRMKAGPQLASSHLWGGG